MSRLTLPELNALDVITWHTGEAGGLTRTLSDFQHWNGGIEFTIAWDFDYDDAESQTQHVRISRVSHITQSPAEWRLMTLDTPHGKTDALISAAIHPDVIKRIYATPGALAQGAPTRRFAVAFYGGEL